MMKVTDLVRMQLHNLHNQLERGIGDLTDEQWHWLPDGKGNSIAFIAWHYVRTEDNIVRFILQNRRPTVWMEGSWSERLGLPPVSQGTGMSTEEAHAMRIGDPEGFQTYASQVWASTDDYLNTADESDFESMVLLRPLGEMPKIRALGQVGAMHGAGHAGEIQHLRCLMGLSGLGI
jgi:hypothetical protein